MRRIVLASMIALFAGCSIFTKQTAVNDKGYDIYLLIGQSNMAGRAPLTASLADTLGRVLLFVGDSSVVWEGAANPLNKYSTIRKSLDQQKLGLGYSFARDISARYPRRTIGLVVNARGGTSINSWMPSREYYNEAVRRAREAMEWGRIKGVVWHQGESDITTTDTYIGRLSEMITSLRRDLGDESLPVVVGQIYGAGESEKKFNDMLLKVPDSIPFTAVVLSDSTSTFDNLHFDTKSQLIMGERYAREMIKLVDAR